MLGSREASVRSSARGGAKDKQFAMGEQTVADDDVKDLAEPAVELKMDSMKSANKGAASDDEDGEGDYTYDDDELAE